MWFGKKNVPLPTGVITTSESLEFEVVYSYRYLGIWLCGTLSFSQHIWKLQAKVTSRPCFLYRNCSAFTPAARLTLIQMNILPMLDYGDIIYRSTGKGALERLDVLYHSAIRFATNATYRTHHCNLYSYVNWSVSLYTRHKTHWLMLIYKTFLDLNPSLSELSTAALILHIQHLFSQSHSVNGPQSTHISGSLIFSVHCS